MSSAHAAVAGGAGRILLNPANTTLPIGTATPVDIMFNTANVPVSGVQVVATFTVANPVDLTATIQTNSILSDDGWSFPIKTVTTTGNTTTIQIMALNLNADGYAVNTNTKLATITFTSAHTFTNKAVVFDQTLTKILKKSDASDIAAIPANGGYSTSGSANTPTPTQPGATATHTPTPTQPGATATLTATPVPGNKPPTCSAITSNMTTITGAATLTLTCTGSDTDGTITAADFTFGDGQSTIVESAVGAIGTISTNHYYNTIGSIKATCKVKDNTGTWSTISGACEKILSFKPKSTPTPTPIRSYGDRGSVLTPTPTRYIASAMSPTSTPIRIVGSVISDTPADPNIEEQVAEPTLYPEEEPQTVQSGSNNIWWIIGGIVAIILAFLLLRRKGPPPPPSGQVPIATV